MNAAKFDQLSKAVVSTASRRWVIRSVLATTAAFVVQRRHAAWAEEQDCVEVCSGVTGERRGACHYRCAQGLDPFCEIVVSECPQVGYSRSLFTCECEPNRGN
jgi:hypothetical protein